MDYGYEPVADLLRAHFLVGDVYSVKCTLSSILYSFDLQLRRNSFLSIYLVLIPFWSPKIHPTIFYFIYNHFKKYIKTKKNYKKGKK